MKIQKGSCLALLMVCAWLVHLEKSFGAAVTGQNNNGLAIRKVILYKHGVGYFERRGRVIGQSDVVLTFKKDQMNDLLKSLTAFDLSGGQVSSIVYDNSQTAEQLLSQYNFNLRNGQGLPQILGQLQGSEVELTIVGSNQPLRGTVIGVETRTIKENKSIRKQYRANLLTESGKLRNFDVDEILDLRFLDEKLNQDIEDYLAILYQQHRRDEKRVVLRTAEAGERDLLVSYVTEIPVWKATYRVVLPENDKDKAFLQGWAIVDNVSEEDWENVQLTLVSGLPISFIQNLYDPWYKKRPVVALSQEMALAPTTPESGMVYDETDSRSVSKNIRAVGRSRSAEMMSMAGMMAPTEKFDMAQEMRNLQAETVTREVGDLFEYQIDEPVTIARNQSALIPIVAGEIEGETVSLYNESVRSKNPLSAFRMRNSTGLTLEGGPLTVYQAGSYAGEALIETVKADEQRYITYGVDLGLHVNTKHGSKGKGVHRVIINRGVVRMHEYIIETKAYNLDNKDNKEKTVVIEHPYRKDWKLLNEEKPIEITDNFKRFEVKIPAKKLTTFEVVERRDHWHRIAVTNITPEHLVTYIHDNFLTKKSRQQLEKIISLKAEIVSIDRELKALKNEKKNIFKDQSRLRDNLGRLGRNDKEKRLRSRYIKQLNTQEDRLAEMEKRSKQLQKQRLKVQNQLDDMIENLAQDLTL